MVDEREKGVKEINIRRLKKLSLCIFAVMIILCAILLGFNSSKDAAFAEGEEEPNDSRARIGFTSESFYRNELYLEKNNGEIIVRVYINRIQSEDTPFTLSETRYGGNAPLFVFAAGYVLSAGSEYVDVSFYQVADAEGVSGVRLSDIYIHCDTSKVRVGDIEYFGENEPYDDEYLAVIYDNAGDRELVVEGLPYISYETDKSIESRIICSGESASSGELYYSIVDYSALNTKELVFENYNSVLRFGDEREIALRLVFFDNDRLNLREAYKLEINKPVGFSRIFDISRRRYLDIEEDCILDFAVMDDEPLSDKYIARVQYYQPGTTNPSSYITEGSTFETNIFFDGLNGNNLPSFRLYFSIEPTSTAIYGQDYVIGDNYNAENNLGYIEVLAGGGQFSSKILISTINDRIFNGTRTVYTKFFVNRRNDILLQPIDTICLEIIDNEYLPSNNNIGWSSIGSLNGCGEYENGILTIDESYLGRDSFDLGIETDYLGTAPLNIPVRFEDITAKNGIDYSQENMYSLLLYRPDIGTNKYGINLNIINDLYFSGTRRLKVTIIEEGLTDGLILSGNSELIIDLVGKVEAGYNFIDYTLAEIEDIFSVGKKESLTFKLNRIEKDAISTYLDLEKNTAGAFDEGIHIPSGLFPYEVVWQQNETEKTISFDFLQNWDDTNSAGGLLTCLNANKQPFNNTYAQSQRTTVPVTLYQSNSDATYYFPGNKSLPVLRYEYLYSEGNLKIEVRRELLAATLSDTSIDYHLTFDYYKPEQIITSINAAEIGVHIDDLNGTLYFSGDETTKYITVTLPDTVNMGSGSKYINIVLSNPSDKTYILNGFDYDGKFNLAQIKITNDVTPVLEYADISTITEEVGGYTTSYINPFEYDGKEYDSFRVELTPYLPDETPSTTSLYYSQDIKLYSVYNLLDAGVEVFGNGQKINCTSIEPYEYNYTDASGNHQVTYNFAYVLSSLLNSERPFAIFTLKYSEIAEKGLAFLTTSVLVKAKNEFFMNGWDSFEKRIILKGCAEGASVEVEMIPTSPVSLGESDVKVGDMVFLKIIRSSTDIAASTMFFTSPAYGVKSFSPSASSPYYYELLDTFVVFEPYEHSKIVPFVTRDQRPVGINWDESAAVAQIKLYDYLNPEVVFQELTVNVLEEFSSIINADVSLLTEYAYIHKLSEQQYDPIKIKFSFDKQYDTDISFTLSGLDQRLSNMNVVLPAGQREIKHLLAINEEAFTSSSEILSLDFSWEMITEFNDTELKLTLPKNASVVVVSESIVSQKFHAGEPSAISIKEDSKGYISLDVIAYRQGGSSQWRELYSYVQLAGSAIYGQDYTIRYDGLGSDNIFEKWPGIVIIGKGSSKSTIKIYPLDNSLFEEAKTIELTLCDYHYGYIAYPEKLTFTIEDNEYFGDVDMIKSDHISESEWKSIDISRSNFTVSDLTLNYEIEEIEGVYGVDYAIGNGGDKAKSGDLTFQGSDSLIKLYVRPITEKGKSSNFYFKISSSLEDGFSLITKEILVSLLDISDGGQFLSRVYKQNTELNKWPGNYGDYLLDYTKYYAKYLSGEKVKIASKVFGGVTKDVYLDFDQEGLTYISISGASTQYKVPSGISANKWVDINNDGQDELVFIANLDSCFGGMTELTALNLLGIYALDLISGEYTLIFSLDISRANLHMDLYLSDLKGDDFCDAVVFLTPWADIYQRKKGGNSIFVIDNIEGEFSTNEVFDGQAKINGSNMVLFSVAVYEKYKGFNRHFIEVSYYSHDEGFKIAYGAVIELSSGVNANIIYCGSVSAGFEGTNLVIPIYNVAGKAGSASIIFESDNAIYGRDYLPNRIDVTFVSGEYLKNVNLVTLQNNVPTDDLVIKYHLESQDFNIADKNTVMAAWVMDKSVVNREVAYTIHDEFDSSFTSTSFITGDSALFDISSLTIDGIRCAAENNNAYDVGFSVRFGSEVWLDEDRDGKIYISGLESLYLELGNLSNIYVDVEFLEENTENVFSQKTFSVYYCYFTLTNSSLSLSNLVTISETLYSGKMNIFAESKITQHDVDLYTRSKLSITTNIDNKTYNFYSGNDGYINAHIDFGKVKGVFSCSYTLTNLSVSVEPYERRDIVIAAYLDTMDFPITIIDSVRQTLLRGVLIEVNGINTNYSYTGRSNSETGLFTLPALTPQKTYSIRVNNDYGISYFEIYSGSFTPTAFQPNLSLTLELRAESVSLDKLTVYTIRRYEVENSLRSLNRDNSFGACNYGKIYDYLANKNVVLGTQDMNLLNEYLKRTFVNNGYGYTDYYSQIRGDVLFSSDYPGVYKSLVKRDPSDITLIYYRYNPDNNFGDINVLLGRKKLTSANSRFQSKSLTYDMWGTGDFVTDNVHFYSFIGAENCIIDLEIVSDAYLSGKKSIPLASFGTGLGSFLLEPVQEVFSSIETATVPTSFAFLDGMSFLLGFADVDFAYDYDEENMTFSLYMGASKGVYESSRGMNYGDIDRPTLSQLREARSAGLSMGRGQAGLGVGLGGKMMFKYVDGDWKLLAGEIYFSVNASYNYTKYILLPIVSIPAFFSATISLEVQTTIYFAWDEAEQYTEITGDLAIELAVEIECGIGIKGFLSASVYGRAGIEVIIQLESGATKLTLYVEGGVRIQIIFWKYDYSFGRAEWSTQSDGYIDREQVLNSLHLSALSSGTDYSGVAALYTVEGQLYMGITLGDDGQAQEVILVGNVYEKSSPKIAELPDGTKMIAWINYDIERGEDNAEVINYIYYDGENWNDVGVADDTLTADLDIDLKVLNNQFAIVCTEVKEELVAGSSISERLLKSDVAILVFDSNSNTFEKTVLTDNLFNDRQVLFDYEDGCGIAFVYRSENTNITDEMTVNDFLCGEDADNKLYYSIYNAADDSWGGFNLIEYSLSAVSSMSLKIVNGIAYLALECDYDDNFDTSADREIVLVQYIFSSAQTRITYLTDNNYQDISPALMSFSGKVFMAYRSGNDVRYWYENNTYYVSTLPQSHTNFEMFAGEDYAVMLYTMSVEGISQVFASIMDKESMMFSEPKQVTFSEKPLRDPILSFDSNNLTLYYCADTYTLLSSEEDEEYVFSVSSDIMTKEMGIFSDLSIDVLDPDYSVMLPEVENEFTVRLYNYGNLNVMSPWIKAYVGESLIAEFAAGIVPGNGYLDVSCGVVLPSNRSTIRFEVGKTGLSESVDNNSAEIEVLLLDLAVEKDYSINRNEDGTLSVHLRIRNSGPVDGENISLILTGYSDISSIFASQNILSILSGQTQEVELIVPRANVIFNANNEFWLKAYVLTEDRDIYSVEADDYDTSDNVISLRTARVLFAGGTTLEISRETMDINVGENGYLNYLYSGDGDVVITSSDPSIVLVNGRNIIPLRPGTVTLTITDGNEIRTLVVTVSQETITENPTIINTPEPQKEVEWWVYVVSIVGGLIVVIIVTFACLYLIWKKKGISKMSFLDSSFKKVNKLLFKTEFNDVEIQKHKEETIIEEKEE